jgi:hypothetical protein
MLVSLPLDSFLHSQHSHLLTVVCYEVQVWVGHQWLNIYTKLFRVCPSILRMKRLHRVIDLRLGSRPYGPNAPKP